MKALRRISVVIPTFRRCASVERALRSLSVQTLPADQYEVIVSIDGSEDGTREMLARFPAHYRLRSHWQPNRGRAAACNAGIRLADAELVVLLDDDMEPTTGFLEAHHRAHAADPHSRLCIMGAAPIAVSSLSPPATRYIATKFNRHLEHLARAEGRFSLRDFYSGNCSISRRTLLAVGGFDEAFTIYGNEDLELSVRLLRAGIRLAYDAGAVARQHHTKSFAELARDNLSKGRTAVLFASKHPAVLSDLQLGAYSRTRLQWRVLRSGLLGLHALSGGAPFALIYLIERLERMRPPFLDLIYRSALDYFYWAGVHAALRENRRIGQGLTILPRET
jgi:GT2 family glycosyltransferase